MSVVKQQSLQSSTIQIMGAMIGALSTIFIYPLDFELYGLYGFLTNTASLLVPFVSLGFGSALLRYFPYFKNKERRHFGFFGFVFCGYAAGIVLFASVFLYFYPAWSRFLTQGDQHMMEYIPYVLPLTVLYVVFDLFTSMSVNFQRITLPALLIFIMKLLLPLIFILTFREYLNRNQFIQLIGVYYILVILMLAYYLKSRESLHYGFRNEVILHPLRGQILRFAMFSIIGGASAILALRIDSILITSILGPAANGQFTLAIFMSNVAYIPAAALTDSLNAVVSAWSKLQNKPELQTVYAKSSRNMLIPTLWVSLCIFCSFQSLSRIMPNSETVAGIEWVLGFLLLARIIDAATGVNHHILSYSRHYALEMYLLLLMAGLNLLFNYFWIPAYGIAGAAAATLLSVCLYNILKTIMVYAIMKIHPFSKNLMWILICGLLTGLVFYWLPVRMHPLLNILVISSGVSLCFLGTILACDWSPELKQMIERMLRQLIYKIKAS
ncbi:MAG TPA: polysaccharide biosynthesis C-terminal domain-containing protein [Saprospiraceae bacterium]|nr:polysaccharide biosynthesis C-terminal domain-containing protein [Saprospiraceae bacterium]